MPVANGGIEPLSPALGARRSPRTAALAAFGIATFATLLIVAEHVNLPQAHSDFSVLWTAGKIILAGGNPYSVIGPAIGYEYEFHHPLTTAVAFIPLTLLPEKFADVLFVFCSTFLFGFAALRDDWNRIWLFFSSAFVICARAGQLAILIASVYYLPRAGFLLPLKPTIGASLLLSRRTIASAAVTGLVLLSISLIINPDWILQWWRTTGNSWEYTAPIRRTGGFVLVLALLRWRTKEARFLFLLSLIPQVSSWYEAVLPMLVGRTKREHQVLSFVSSLGYLLLIVLLLGVPERQVPTAQIGRLMVAFCYLPALIVILRRPNIPEDAEYRVVKKRLFSRRNFHL